MRINQLTTLLLICLFSSCAKESIEDQLVGVWNLSTVITNCKIDASTLDTESVNADDMGCVILTSEQVVDGVTLTVSDESCGALRFDANGSVTIFAGTSMSMDSNVFGYTVNSADSTVEVCTTTTFCANYTLEDGVLSVILPLVGPSLDLDECTRTFEYRKL